MRLLMIKTIECANPAGLVLADLRRIIKETELMAATTPVKATVRLGGQLKSLKVVVQDD
jgi:hypothetical protein